MQKDSPENDKCAMSDDQKTKAELIEELNALRSRIAELKAKDVQQRQIQPEQSENTFKMVFDNAPDGMVLADVETRKFRMANNAICQTLGYSHHEIVRLGVEDIHPLEDLPYIVGQFDKLSRGEISVALDIPVKRKDGSIFYADISSAETTISGRAHLMGLFRDVTDRKRSQEQLLIKSAAIETSISALGITDMEGKLIYVNQACVNMWGYKDKNEMLGRYLPEFWEGERVYQTIKNLEEKGADTGDDVGKRKDGSIFNVLFIASIIRNEQGKPFGMLGSFLDITERRTIEEQLRASEEKYRFLYNSVPTGIGISDFEGNILDFNRTMEQLTGYSRDEFKSMNIRDIYVCPEDRDKVIRTLKEKGRALGWEQRLRAKDGRILYLLVNTEVVERGGEKVLVTTSRDISDRKEAEEALRESEQKYRTLINNIPDVVWTSDSDGNSTFVSPNVEKIYGFTPQEICDQRHELWLKRVHPDDLQRVENAYRALLNKNLPFDVEYRIRRKDGHWIWLHDRSIATYEKNGRKYADGIFSDITTRKVVEMSLRESQANLELTQQIAHFGSWERNLETGKVTWSDETYRLFGFEPGQVEPTFDLLLNSIHPEDREFVRRASEKAASEGQQFHLECRIIRPDGIERVLDGRGQILLDDQGKPIRIMGGIQDITERRRIENALRESEGKYRTLVESAGETIASIDKDGVFLFMNTTGAERLGGKPDDYIGKRMWDLFPKEIADRQMSSVRRVIKTHSGINVIVPTLLQGQTRWYNTTIEPLISGNSSGNSGEVNSVMLIARDIHEIKQAQDKLARYREKMAHTDRLASLGTLSATVAHELTQPLTVIRLSLDNLLDELKAASSPENVNKKVEASLDEISNITSIINRFRTFARKSSVTSLQKVNLKALAERIIQFLGESARQARISLHIDGLDGLPLVQLNERDFEQLFFALVQNAVQAADEKKQRSLTICGRVKDRNIELRFTDDCGGIAPEDLRSVFKPFFTTKPPDQGTGLGLCIVSDIASRAGGKVSLESEFGKGSTFIVTLPCDSE